MSWFVASVYLQFNRKSRRCEIISKLRFSVSQWWCADFVRSQLQVKDHEVEGWYVYVVYMPHLNDNLVSTGPHPDLWITVELVITEHSCPHVKHVLKIWFIRLNLACRAVWDKLISPSIPYHIELKMVVYCASSVTRQYIYICRKVIVKIFTARSYIAIVYKFIGDILFIWKCGRAVSAITWASHCDNSAGYSVSFEVRELNFPRTVQACREISNLNESICIRQSGSNRIHWWRNRS